MTTNTLTITEFLTARLTEDLVTATMRGWHASDCDTIPNESGYSYPCDCGVPERMKRDVEAKRRIVAAHRPVSYNEAVERKAGGCKCRGGWPCPTLCALASVYSDHLDYHRDQWRTYP